MPRSDECSIASRFINACRQRLFATKVADSTGAELTGGKLLAAALAAGKYLQRSALTTEEVMVGVLLPPSVGAAVANAALTLIRRVPVNLNYMLSAADLQHCVSQAQIRHVSTSRRFLEQRPVQFSAELLFLEDRSSGIAASQRAVATATAYLTPVPLLVRWLGLNSIQPDDQCTVIFTSGTTGRPKEVMLSQRNIMSNINAVIYTPGHADTAQNA